MLSSPGMQFISDMLALSFKHDNSCVEANPLPFSGHINWDEFIPLVNQHRVGGLLFYWIRKLRLENKVPRGVYGNLKRICEHFVTIWEDHRRILKRILIQFQESKTEIILLKGAQLGGREYPYFGLRPIEDIDILIRRPDRSKVIKFMLGMGLNLYETNQTCDKFFIRGKKAGKPIFIEIHSDLQTPIRLNRAFNIDIDEFWKGAQEITADGYSFLQLCPTDNLIYIGVHLGHHHFSRLIWAYDIALLIHRHREEVDWEKLKDLCGRMKIRNPLYHSLTLCRELFHIPIPETVLKSLSPSWWKGRIGHFLIRRNLQRPERPRGNRLTQFLIRIFLADSWMEAVLWFFIPTREWIVREYSLEDSKEIYPYYLLHPILYLIKTIRPPMR